MRPSLFFVRLVFLTLILSAVPMFLTTAWPFVLMTWSILLIMSALDILFLLRSPPIVAYAAPQTAYVGEEIPLYLSIDSKFPVRVEVECWFETEKPIQEPAVLACTLEPESNRLCIPLHASHRGEGQVLGFWLKVKGPLRCFERMKRYASVSDCISVVPSLPRVKRLALQHFGLWQYNDGLRLEHLPGEGSEFDALQNYAPGHDLREIDWKASARHQQLKVRRYRVEQNQRMVFSLDAGHLMADDLGGMYRLDHAIHTTLLLSHFALRAGDLVGLHAYADRPQLWLPPRSGIRNFHRMHMACAGVHVHNTETNHVRGLHHLLSQIKRRTLVVIFSEFSGKTTAELLLDTLAFLMEKHLVLFVVLEDPTFEKPFLH
ncbi:MAG: DUF58 domain-containing protein, partial [Myxococcota bacterium]